MILVVAEHTGGKLKKSSYELISAARTLAHDLQHPIVGLVLGETVTDAATELTTLTERVISVEDSALATVRAEPYTTAITTAAKQLDAKIVLIAASRSGMSYSPRVAVRLTAALLEDVTSLRSEGEAVVATRLSYLSRVTETVKAQASPVVISVKPNVFPVAEANATGSSEALSVNFETHDTRVTVGEKHAARTGRVALEEAAVVVTGGRGIGSPEGFSTLVEPLADDLSAGVGATRAVVDAGWRPYGEQVGQTGKSVAPEVYVALGVSGAVQHLSGMNRSKVIVAINKDPDAPIFKVADYGVVGDVNRVVPALREALAAQKS